MSSAEPNALFSGKQRFCYIFYACVGGMILFLHSSHLLSDPESLPMLIIIGWPVSIPVILFFLVWPAIKVTKYTFSVDNSDVLLKIWFWINLIFWMLFISNLFPVIPSLLLEGPAIRTLSYVYSGLTILLPVVKIILPSSVTQVSAIVICLLLACTTLYFYNFQQGEFTSRVPISTESISLHKAIDEGDLDEVKRLVQAGADIHAIAMVRRL